MKTLARILVIVTAFAIVMSAVYFAVNAGGASSSNPRGFERGDGFSPDGPRPEFRGEGFPPGGERPEFRGEGRGGGWIFGLIKNVGILAVIVTLIVLPKNLLQRKRQPAPVRIDE